MRFGIRTNVADVLETLAPHLPAASKPSASPVVDYLVSVIVGRNTEQRGLKRFHLAYVNGVQFARTLELERLIEAVAYDLERHVAASAPRELVIHAGVVGWHGRAILIPGRSGSGKSTLVARMLHQGATYYSDEFAFLDHRGRVHPFRRALRLRGEDGKRRTIRDAELVPQAALPPLAVSGVLFASFRAGATWRPRRLSPANATLELLAHSVNGRLVPGQAIATLKRVVSNAEVLEGERGEADEIVRWLADTFRDQAALDAVARP